MHVRGWKSKKAQSCAKGGSSLPQKTLLLKCLQLLISSPADIFINYLRHYVIHLHETHLAPSLACPKLKLVRPETGLKLNCGFDIFETNKVATTMC